MRETREQETGEGEGRVVLVCGGRTYANRTCVWTGLDALHREFGVRRLVHGGATGADALAAEWARERGVPAVAYPADWKAHGRAAGPIRNQHMLDTERPGIVVAYPGGRGTADMTRRAIAAGITLFQERHP